MDYLKLRGVTETPLKIINNPSGDILHGMKQSDLGFEDFGEAYFSCVNSKQVKAWTRHSLMTLNLLVPSGKVLIVIYDDDPESESFGLFHEVSLSLENYKRLTIKPGLWVGYKGLGNGKNLILNIADFEHDENEMQKRDTNSIDYNWNKL